MTRPDQISTFDHTAADGLVWRNCVISKSLRMRRLVCAFVVCKTLQDSFLTSRPLLCFLNIKGGILKFQIQYNMEGNVTKSKTYNFCGKKIRISSLIRPLISC